MAEIEIFLSIPESQLSFLSIPRSDIDRLAVCPFRWIRYVMFTICGARGDLSPTPIGPPVDYDKTEFPDAENTYYYRPSEDCVFVDHQGLNDRSTTTAQTQRRHDFRRDVIRRDGHACVVTQEPEKSCDAAHLIPRSKGDEYITKVIQLRSRGDNLALPSDVGIDDIVNGILLSKNLHVALGDGDVAFIKTPNYGLRPEDIRRFPRGGERPYYITLHRLKKPQDYEPTMLANIQALGNGDVDPGIAYLLGVNVDALILGDGVSPPSTIVLDYAYGVAAYKCWHSKHDGVPIAMDAYRKEHYAQIPPFSRTPPDDTSGPDDPTDSAYNSPESRKRDEPESDLAKAMDDLNMVLMYIHGITPEQAAERRQKEIEQEERAAQDASRSKVMEWRKHMDVH